MIGLPHTTKFFILPMYDFWDTSSQILECQFVPVHAIKAHGVMEE